MGADASRRRNEKPSAIFALEFQPEKKKSEEQVKKVFICPECNISFLFLHAGSAPSPSSRRLSVLSGKRAAASAVVSAAAAAAASNGDGGTGSPDIFHFACIYSIFAVIFIIKIGQFMKIGLCLHSNIHENKSVVYKFFVVSRFFVLSSARVFYSYCFSRRRHRCNTKFLIRIYSALCFIVFSASVAVACACVLAFFVFVLFISGAFFYLKCYLFNFTYALNYSFLPLRAICSSACECECLCVCAREANAIV